MEESDLVQRVKEGDKVAFQILFENFNSRILNTCLSYLQHREEAEEITQDIFIEIHRSIGNYEVESTASLSKVADTFKDNPEVMFISHSVHPKLIRYRI